MEEQFEAGSCKMESELNTDLARRLLPSARPNSVFIPFISFPPVFFYSLLERAKNDMIDDTAEQRKPMRSSRLAETEPRIKLSSCLHLIEFQKEPGNLFS
ncbi:hypothetical protein OIU76_013936 [Salix suchowensis]|nr:hypothetical protein OIU76_013936 [Salix suchowensis]